MNIIQHKRNSSPGAIPNASSLSIGELAINTKDGILYTKNSSGNIINLPLTSISGATITANLNGNATTVTSGVYTSRSITPGSGLVGSAALDLSADRTLHVGQGDGINVTADAIAVNDTVVRTTGTQSITGTKVFKTQVKVPSGMIIGLDDTFHYNYLIGNMLSIPYTDTGWMLASFDTAAQMTNNRIALNARTTFNTASLFSSAPLIIDPTGYLNSGAVTQGYWRGTAIETDKGGTGRTSYSNGQLLIGSGTSLAANTLTTGTGISITNGSGSITINTNATSSNIASAIVSRDSSGNFSAGNITANRFIASSGTNSLASYNFDNDSDTGLFSPLTNTISLSTSGVERIRISNNGRVGINTSNPTGTLHIVGPATGNAIWVGGNNIFPYSIVFNGYLWMGSSSGNAGMNATTRTIDELVEAGAAWDVDSGVDIGSNYICLNEGLNRDNTTYNSICLTAGFGPQLCLNSAVVNEEDSPPWYEENLRVGINTLSPRTKLDINGKSIRIRYSHTPSTSNSDGLKGTICWDSNYLYICYDDSDWKRIPLSGF